MDSWMALSEMPEWKDKAIALLVVMAFVVFIAVLGFVIRPNSLSYPGLAAFMVTWPEWCCGCTGEGPLKLRPDA